MKAKLRIIEEMSRDIRGNAALFVIFFSLGSVILISAGLVCLCPQEWVRKASSALILLGIADYLVTMLLAIIVMMRLKAIGSICEDMEEGESLFE